MSLNAALALAAALLVAGAAFGLASLYVPGIALAALATGSVAWLKLAARGARVERAAGPATVVEGEAYPLRIDLRGGILPPRGELVDPLLEHPVRISVLGSHGVRVGVRRAGARLVEESRFTRRGRQRLEPPRMVITDPLGLCSQEVEGVGGTDVLVLPRIEPVHADGGASDAGEDGGAGAGEDPGSGLGGAAGDEIDGLRPYRKGSPASRIHWRAVARHGDLIERRLASGEGGTAIVVLDAERPADREALDRAVRAAASLCVHLARAGGCTLVAPGATRPLQIDPQLRGWSRAHARLAMVESGASAGAGFRAAGGGPTFWVTATAAAPIPKGLPRGSFLVTPLPVGSRRRVAFTVAGCHGLQLDAARAVGRRARSAA